MSERRWTAIILCILVTSVIMYKCWNSYDIKRPHTLNYKQCSIIFHYYNSVDTADISYPAANNKLALCLCETYIKKPDKDVSKRIMLLYQRYGIPVKPFSSQYSAYQKLDTILKYRKVIFNTLTVLE